MDDSPIIYDLQNIIITLIINVQAGMWEKSLSLFKEMEEFGILQDEDCYSGAIWACVGGVKWQKAVELLKLMKFEGICCFCLILLYLILRVVFECLRKQKYPAGTPGFGDLPLQI